MEKGRVGGVGVRKKERFVLGKRTFRSQKSKHFVLRIIQQFYKKMSFWQFCYRNQSYWEEKTLKITTRPKLKTFDEFEQDIRDGYYDRVKMCLSLKSLIKVLEMFPNHRAELIDMFNYSMSELVDENLWK